ncbi:MAG: hypothetical protein JKY09_07360 [Crocinitomicaceae bacterium]|nr:hypothetical protein [Crocinitomicaceae bacterium]
MNKLFVLVFIGFSTFCYCQDDEGSTQDSQDTKVKVFFNFNGKKSFLKNDTKYFGFDFGIKAKCKYKFGFGYSWLKGTYNSDLFPVSTTEFPNALADTRTDAKFYSVLFEPIVFSHKKINISIPIHVGVSDLSSEYKKGTLSYEEYHKSTPLFGDVSANFDFRVFGFMKVGLSLGYRYVGTDLKVASEVFNTPLIGFSLKFGGMCK